MMKWMWNSSTVALSLALIGSVGLAETQPGQPGNHGGGAPTTQPQQPSGDGAIRPPAGTGLRSQEVDLISYFFTQPKTFVGKRYVQSVPEAIKDSRSGKPEGLSKVLAELMGTLDDKQRDAVMDKSEMLRKAKTLDDVKDPYLKSVMEKVFTDGDFRELTDKIYLAINVLKGTAGKIEGKTPEDDKFIKQFNEDFDKQLEKNKKIHDAIAKAIDPNAPDDSATKKEAKAFLRNEINRDAVMAFLDGQRISGNSKLASDLADALSWKENGTGKKFLDFNATNLQGQTEMQRLLLGTSKTDIDAALKAYSNSTAFKTNAGLHGVSLAGAQFPTPQRVLEFDAKADGGKGGLVDATPVAKAADPAPGQPQPVQGQGGTQGRPATGGQPQGGQRTAEQAPPPRPVNPDAKAQAIIAAKCNNCHGPNGTERPVNNNANALKRINANGQLKMPKGGSLTDDELATLRAFYSK